MVEVEVLQDGFVGVFPVELWMGMSVSFGYRRTDESEVEGGRRRGWQTGDSGGTHVGACAHENDAVEIEFLRF